MKNYRTPRTLADASFEVGYRYERQARRADLFLAVVCGAAAGLMLLGII